MIRFLIFITISLTLFLFSMIYSNKNSVFEDISNNIKKGIKDKETTIAIIPKGDDAKSFLNILTNSIKSDNIKVITRNKEDIKIAENEIKFSREFSEEEKELSVKYSSAKYLLIFSYANSEIKIKIQETSTLDMIKLDKSQYHIRNLPSSLEDILLYLSLLILTVGSFLFWKEKNEIQNKNSKFEILIKSAKELLDKKLFDKAELRIIEAEQIYTDRKELHLLKNDYQILKEKVENKIKEDKFEILIKSANELLDKYLFSEAETRIIEAAKLFPDNRELHLVKNNLKISENINKIYCKAEASYNEYKYDEALKSIQEIEHIQTDFRNLKTLKENVIQNKITFDELYNSAYLFLKENKTELAKDRIDKFLNKNPHHINARKLKNDIKIKIEENKKHELKQQCDDLYTLAYENYKRNNFDLAREKVEDLLKLNPNETNAHELKGKILDKIKENIFFGKIDNLFQNNEFDTARELLNDFLVKNVAHNKGIKYQSKLKTIHLEQIVKWIKKCFENTEYSNIEDLFKKAKAIKEDEEINLLEKKYYSQKFISEQLFDCDKLVVQKKFTKAESKLKIILKEKPDDTSAALLLKKINNSIANSDELFKNSRELYKSGKLNQAIEKLQFAVRENPENEKASKLFETLKSQTNYEDKIKFVLKEGSTIKKEVYLFACNVAEIGRNEETDVPIDSKYLSGKHCHFMLKGGEFLIEDLHSSNGTKVNNNRISNYLLNDKDIVQLAKRLDFNFKAFGEKEKSENATLIDDENTYIQKIISGKLEMATSMLPKKDLVIISGKTDLAFILDIKSTSQIFHSDGKFWLQENDKVRILAKNDIINNYQLLVMNG